VAGDHPRVLPREEMADEGRGVRIGAAQEAQEILATAPLVAREAQRRDQHREEDLLDAQRTSARLALHALEELDALLVHGIEAAREHRLEKLFLASEVVVDRREVHARRGGEAAQARRLEAVLHELRFGG